MGRAKSGVAAFGVAVTLVSCGSEPTASTPPAVSMTTTVAPHGSPSAVAPSGEPPAPGPSPSKTTTSAPTSVPASLLGMDVELMPASTEIVALTFDGGASDDAVRSILATLSAKEVPATFFFTGDFVVDFPAASNTVARAGHRLGNHSMTHPHFTDLTAAKIGNEVSQAQQTIQRVTGRSPQPLFRFPYGDRDARTIAAVNRVGYVAVRWTVDTLGWKGTSGGQSVDSVLRRALGGLQPGEIVLMHVGAHPTDHSTLDADALPEMIDAMRAHGYTFVTLDALLAS